MGNTCPRTIAGNVRTCKPMKTSTAFKQGLKTSRLKMSFGMVYSTLASHFKDPEQAAAEAQRVLVATVIIAHYIRPTPGQR